MNAALSSSSVAYLRPGFLIDQARLVTAAFGNFNLT